MVKVESYVASTNTVFENDDSVIEVKQLSRIIRKRKQPSFDDERVNHRQTERSSGTDKRASAVQQQINTRKKKPASVMDSRNKIRSALFKHAMPVSKEFIQVVNDVVSDCDFKIWSKSVEDLSDGNDADDEQASVESENNTEIDDDEHVSQISLVNLFDSFEGMKITWPDAKSDQTLANSSDLDSANTSLDTLHSALKESIESKQDFDNSEIVTQVCKEIAPDSSLTQNIPDDDDKKQNLKHSYPSIISVVDTPVVTDEESDPLASSPDDVSVTSSPSQYPLNIENSSAVFAQINDPLSSAFRNVCQLQDDVGGSGGEDILDYDGSGIDLILKNFKTRFSPQD
ncbi:hypothetical protein V1514DRAFT_327717 [Lipomyces japonicus]|uniref:uncharacterized protein n=1 Tax=Lipomyces japonicus TaxID=56871 RepID=UPI0034CED01E